MGEIAPIGLLLAVGGVVKFGFGALLLLVNSFSTRLLSIVAQMSMRTRTTFPLTQYSSDRVS